MDRKHKIEIREEQPLKWPEGWERTRIKDQKPQPTWKRTLAEYKAALIHELKLMGATEVMISYNGALTERQDPGVAVYFSRSPIDDFSWQEALGIDNPAPSIQEIDAAFRKLAMPHHPDRVAMDIAAGKTPGDPLIFMALEKHRQRAKAWINGTHTKEHEFVIPIDQFKEVRLNIAGVRLAVNSFRSLEKVGAPSILERTFRGFRTALPANASTSEVRDDAVA